MRWLVCTEAPMLGDDPAVRSAVQGYVQDHNV
jgi:hypothetical protein